MSTPAKSVNAWLFVGEDDPAGTTYFSPNSSYQSAVRNGIYRYATMLNICFFNTVPTAADTYPSNATAQGYTIQIAGAADHHPTTDPNGPTGEQYFEQLIVDARNQHAGIPLLATLIWGDGQTISRIFSTPGWTPQQCAATFAANLMAFFQHFGLNGLDIDWESPLSDDTSSDQLNALLTAVRAEYAKQPGQTFYLTMSPVTTTNMTASVINDTVDFLNLQLYGGTDPSEYTSIGINPSLLAYGAKFESSGGGELQGYQTAQDAYAGYVAGNYRNMTQWRLNSGNFPYEQAEQMILHQLVFGLPDNSFDDAPIVATAGNPPITQLVVRSGEVLDAIQATNTGPVPGLPVSQSYELLQHGGNGGIEQVLHISPTDPLVKVSGYTGTWFGWNVVVQIQFTTKSGATFGPYGTMSHVTAKTSFTATAPANQSILAFRGSTVTVPEASGGQSAIIATLTPVFG